MIAHGDGVYFYELHETDDELFSDVLLAHDTEFAEDEFLELVLEARGDVLARFEEDTLIEAVANELERRHGFVHVSDERIRAAVNVSANEGETVVASVAEGAVDGQMDGDDAEAYRSLLIEVDPEDPR